MSEKLIYAGIGSRSTPPEILSIMQDFAYIVAPCAILRSGGAPGADQAFGLGATRGHGEKEIYLPWRGFEGHTGELSEPTSEALRDSSYVPSSVFIFESGCKEIDGS
jgi:hypothetical protein